MSGIMKKKKKVKVIVNNKNITLKKVSLSVDLTPAFATLFSGGDSMRKNVIHF